MKRKLYCKTFTIGIIVLFIGVSVSSAISLKSNTNNEELYRSDWIATIRMDFGYQIYNDKIICREQEKFEDKEYYIETIINFDIPTDKTKKVDLIYYIEAYYFHYKYPPNGPEYIIYEFKERSLSASPPDIYKKTFTRIDPVSYGDSGSFSLCLYMWAHIDVYEYDGNDWIKVDEDHTSKRETVSGYIGNPRVENNPLLRFLDMFPILQRILQRLG